MSKSFTNPYELYPEWRLPDGTCRLVSRVPKNEYNKVYSIDPKKGVMQIVINLLHSKLIKALESHGIKSFEQQDEFRRFIAECEIVTPTDLRAIEQQGEHKGRLKSTLQAAVHGGAVAGPLRQANALDERGREEDKGAGDTIAKDQLGPLQGKVGGGRARRSGKAKSNDEKVG